MPSALLRRAVLPAVLAASLPIGVGSPAFAAPSAGSNVADKAAALLARDLSNAGTVVGSYQDDKGRQVSYTDYGRTLDAALGLLAAGSQDGVLGRALTTVESHDAVASYTQGAPGDKAGAAYVGATAKLAFVVAATGGHPSDVGGVNLLTQLTSLEQSNGRFADNSSFGNYANVFGHAFALLALKQSGQAVPDAIVQGLISAKCLDGAFPETYPASSAPCKGSVDATGLVLQALAAVGQGSSQVAKGASAWLTQQQRSDGSFPGQAPVNSTGYAVLGLDAVGAPIGKALSYLSGEQNGNGGLRTGVAGSTKSDDFATSQGLPALAGKTFVDSARTVARQAVLAVSRTLITAAGSTVLTIQAPPGALVDVYAYTRPSTTFRVLRSGTVGSNGVLTYPISLQSNTRLYAQTHNGMATPQVVIGVRPALSLRAARSGVRTYVFSGRSLPARSGGLIISLFRFSDPRHQVLTAQTRANAKNGDWSLTRTFTGTGAFDFVVRAGGDMQNAAGASNVQRVRIY